VGIRGVAVSKNAPRVALAVLSLALIAPPPARAECATPRVLLERYLHADCDACWRAAPPIPAAPAPGGPTFVLDWIVPSSGAAQTPMSQSALADAAQRAARAGSLRSDEVLTQSTPLPARSALRLKIEDGPAWNGYVALKFEASYDSSRPLPQGLAGYLAVVERIAAGDEGSPVARQVVRTVIGPLPLDGLARDRKVDHLRAARFPETAKPERVVAVGWLETPAGRVLAVASARADAGCQRTP
jgi:hypothetical protein